MSKSLVNLTNCLVMAALTFTGCGHDKSTKKSEPSPQVSEPGTPVDGAIFSKNRTFQVKLDWITGPINEDPSSVKVSLFNLDGAPAEDAANFSFLPFMTVHGHPGSTKMMSVETEKPGVYKVQDFYFTMAGPWDLIIKATIGGAADEAVIGVDIP